MGWSEIAVALITGWIGSLLYGVFIAHREGRIRGYLASKTDSWRRRRFVRAFVGAIRGKSASSDTYMLAILFLALPFGAGFYLLSDIQSMEGDLRTLGVQLD